jgi:hypothetical protein
MPSDYRQILVYILLSTSKATGSPILDQSSEQLFHPSKQITHHSKSQRGEQWWQHHKCCQVHLNPKPAQETTHHYPFGFSRGLGYQPEVVIQLALFNLIDMIITVPQFTLFIHLPRQSKQINGTDKQLLYRALQMIQWIIASIHWCLC